MKFELEKFKQSNVARIFIAYAVVAFGMMQIFDYLLPIIEAPLWVAQTLTLLLFLGFPISLLVGWVTQRPVISSNTEEVRFDSGYAHSLSRQKLILLGLGSSVIFGFLGFISMPYLLDQASFSQAQLNDDGVAPAAVNRRSVRSEINLGATGLQTFWGYRTEVALSPDGTKLAFVTFDGTGGALYIRDLQALDSTRLVASMDRRYGKVSFSKDGEWLVYIDNLQIKRVRVEGGAPQIISEENNELSGVVLTDENVYFSGRNQRKLYRSAINGASEREILAEGGSVFLWPEILPGETHLLITRANDSMSIADTGSIELLNLRTLEREILIESAFNARYAQSGHIVFSRDAAIWAVPFDLANMELTGNQTPVVLEVETEQRRGSAIYSFSEDGRMVYLRGNEIGDGDGGGALAVINRNDQSVIKPDMEFQLYGNLALSPRENEVALTIYESPSVSDIWIWDLNRNILGRRTFEGMASKPVWAPDGQTLLYQVYRDGDEDNGIWSIVSNGSSQASPIFLSEDGAWPRTISADNELVFTLNHGSGHAAYALDLNSQNLSNSTEPEVQARVLELAPSLNEYSSPTISPNKQWIMYSSIETGVPEVYIRPWPNILEGKWLVSIGGGYMPIWSKSDGEVFYHFRGQQYSVNYREIQLDAENRPSFLEFDRPDRIGSFPLIGSSAQINSWVYRSGADDFLAVLPPNDSITEVATIEEVLSRQVSLVVVENWFEELKSLAPPGFAD